MTADFPRRPLAAVFKQHTRGVLVSVRLSPGASADRIEGIYRASDGSASLKVRVRALPEKGKANKALIKLLAKTLRLAQAGFSIASGATHRNKSVLIGGSGSDEETIGRLNELIRTIGDDDVSD